MPLRFTVQVHAILKGAMELANEFGYTEVTPEAIFFAVVAETDGRAAHILMRASVIQESLMARAETLLPRLPKSMGSKKMLTPQLGALGKHIMSGSIEMAKKLGSDYVGGEHLLLALLADPTTEPAKVCSGFGLDYDAAVKIFNGLKH